jgi:hypothetical protein
LPENQYENHHHENNLPPAACPSADAVPGRRPGMIQFNFTTNGVSTNGIELDWLQLNFNTINSGNYFDNQFDAETNFPGNISGPFSLQ